MQPQGHLDGSLYLPLCLPTQSEAPVPPRMTTDTVFSKQDQGHSLHSWRHYGFGGKAMLLESGLLHPSCLRLSRELRPSTNSQGRQHDSQCGRNNLQCSVNLLPCLHEFTHYTVVFIWMGNISLPSPLCAAILRHIPSNRAGDNACTSRQHFTVPCPWG